MIDPVSLRGIRNNNPGNIDKGQPWEGLAPVQEDERFCTFVSPEYGIRAIHEILQTYQTKHGCNDIEQIIERWAPPRENDTEAYINHVVDVCQVPKGDTVNVMYAYFAHDIVSAIIAHENSGYKYEDSILWKGLQLAGVQPPV